MIAAVEGPDCAGKSTLFKQLKGLLHSQVRFVNIPPQRLQLLMSPLFCYHEERVDEIIWQMHNPELLYVFDRFIAVSSPIYAALKDRPCLVRPVRWLPYLHVIYLDVPVDVLVARLQRRGDEHVEPGEMEKLLNLYRSTLTSFRCTHIHHGQGDALAQALACISELAYTIGEEVL